MADFRSGVYNTLIATCVAEEGIDVGEVDLIICFDVSSKNPTRFVQRIGRTGRKRQGKVVMLVSEGKEQGILKEVIATKDDTNHKLAKSTEVSHMLYRQSPRLVPPEFNPVCVETFIKTAKRDMTELDLDENDENVAGPSKKSRTKVRSSQLKPFRLANVLCHIPETRDEDRQRQHKGECLEKGCSQRHEEVLPTY